LNPGSEPDRDDTGLPRLDVEIPDDARELDRDVQAYYREVRAERRRSRSSRLRRSLSRDGVVLPLLACCLIFALITGTLLTVFSASSINSEPGSGGIPGSSAQAGAGATGTTTAPVLHHGAPMPALTVSVYGQQVPLRSVQPAVLLLVPANCNDCAATLEQIAVVLSGGHVPILLLASSGVPGSELGPALAHGALLATYRAGVLQALQATYPHTGLTAVLVTTGGHVQYAEQLRPGDDMEYLLQPVGM
jgi:hypothetical protein